MQQTTLCDACRQPIQASYYPYGKLAICQTCHDLSFITCDSGRVGVSCKEPTSDNKPKLLKAGKTEFVPNYPRYANNTICLCTNCDQQIPKTKCHGNCGRYVLINNLNILKGETVTNYGTAQIPFCSLCVTKDSPKCGACNAIPIASVASPPPTDKTIFPNASVSLLNGEFIYRCEVCVPKIIADGLAQKYYGQVYDALRKLLAKFLSDLPSSFICPPLILVGPLQLKKENNASKRSPDDAGVSQGILRGFWTNQPTSRIFMETSVPKVSFLSTQAHEITHAFQHVLKPGLDDKTSEGFAQWVAYTLVKEMGESLKIATSDIQNQMQQIEKSSLPNYGNGFRAFKALEDKCGRNIVFAAALVNIDAALAKWQIPIPN